MGTSEPSTEDGLIEVVGLTTYQLVSVCCVLVVKRVFFDYLKYVGADLEMSNRLESSFCTNSILSC